MSKVRLEISSQDAFFQDSNSFKVQFYEPLRNISSFKLLYCKIGGFNLIASANDQVAYLNLTNIGDRAMSGKRKETFIIPIDLDASNNLVFKSGECFDQDINFLNINTISNIEVSLCDRAGDPFDLSGVNSTFIFEVVVN